MRFRAEVVGVPALLALACTGPGSPRFRSDSPPALTSSRPVANEAVTAELAPPPSGLELRSVSQWVPNGCRDVDLEACPLSTYARDYVLVPGAEMVSRYKARNAGASAAVADVRSADRLIDTRRYIELQCVFMEPSGRAPICDHVHDAGRANALFASLVDELRAKAGTSGWHHVRDISCFARMDRPYDVDRCEDHDCSQGRVWCEAKAERRD